MVEALLRQILLQPEETAEMLSIHCMASFKRFSSPERKEHVSSSKIYPLLFAVCFWKRVHYYGFRLSFGVHGRSTLVPVCAIAS